MRPFENEAGSHLLGETVDSLQTILLKLARVDFKATAHPFHVRRSIAERRKSNVAGRVLGAISIRGGNELAGARSGRPPLPRISRTPSPSLPT